MNRLAADGPIRKASDDVSDGQWAEHGLSVVMAGLVPAIHDLLAAIKDGKTWMPGTRPGMTTERLARVGLNAPCGASN